MSLLCYIIRRKRSGKYMHITKCDACKKTIKAGGFYIQSRDTYKSVELCLNCVKPIDNFLKNNGLIIDKTKKKDKRQNHGKQK